MSVDFSLPVAVDLNARDASGNVRARYCGTHAAGARVRIIDETAGVQGWAKIVDYTDFGKIRLEVEWDSLTGT